MNISEKRELERLAAMAELMRYQMNEQFDLLRKQLLAAAGIKE